MNANLTKLGDVCSLITDGKHGDCRDEENSGYYFISAKDVRDGTINYLNARQIARVDFDETHRRTDLMSGDVLITNSGTIGRLAVAQEDEPTPRTTFQKSVAVVKPRRDVLDSHYLYYALEHNRDRLVNAAAGAAQKNLLLGELRRFPIYMPSKDRQQAVVNRIKPLDDLITNNRRRIELLEKSAHLLFKEWFVRLRYPGHEHDSVIDGVPDRWERKTALDTIDVLSGGTPKTSIADYWDGDIPFYTPKDAAEFAWVLETGRSITERGLSNCNSRLYPKGTVFISARGTVGSLNLAQRPMAMSQSCYALVGRGQMSQTFVYCAMESALATLRQQAGGAVFNAIIVDTFKRISVLVPSPEITLAFEELAAPVFAQIELLQIQNDRLVKARDLLLPRLMDGRIPV